jgi:glycine/D-amino acid oxidase-like deaminating enzyme
MASVPDSAQVVVIGAGIVGNSLVHHLARLGWTDIVQIDKGALPNPGGSTGHASNFIFLTDHSREITDLTLDSVEQYQEMGVFTQSGGFEIARTEERMEELRRRMSSARAWGIEAEIVDPAFVKEKVPFIEEDQFIGAFWQPGVGVVDSLRAGTIMRERAMESGALTVVPNVEVVGMDVEDGRIRRATSASTEQTWRSAPTHTARSCTSPRRSPRSSSPSCRRPRCRSPRTTSTRSSSRRWS